VDISPEKAMARRKSLASGFEREEGALHSGLINVWMGRPVTQPGDWPKKKVWTFDSADERGESEVLCKALKMQTTASKTISGFAPRPAPAFPIFWGGWPSKNPRRIA